MELLEFRVKPKPNKQQLTNQSKVKQAINQSEFVSIHASGAKREKTHASYGGFAFPRQIKGKACLFW